jgi:hypothetical protein
VWKRIARGRGSENIGASIANLLTLQSTLFPSESDEPSSGRASDRFSVGYVFGFTVLMLTASGKFRLNDMPPIVDVIFERIFGPGGGRKVIEHQAAVKARNPEATRGAAAGREDAKRFLDSGGKRQVTGWLQHVRADLFQGES